MVRAAVAAGRVGVSDAASVMGDGAPLANVAVAAEVGVGEAVAVAA